MRRCSRFREPAHYFYSRFCDAVGNDNCEQSPLLNRTPHSVLNPGCEATNELFVISLLKYD
jgi:hypothetical protein